MVTRIGNKMEEEKYYLEAESLEADSEDNFSYREVAVEDSPSSSSGEEDFETALQNAQTSTRAQPQASATADPHSEQAEEVVEDFVRNFLVRVGLHRTAEVFQAEWYELQLTGRLQSHFCQPLPDVYSQNQQLESRLEEVQREAEQYGKAARLCREKYVRLKKERDYHRMHHRRVLQERQRMMADITRLRKHFSSYEPLLQQLRKKYESMTKEKTLACLERDRALSEVECLQSTLHSVQQKQSPGHTLLPLPSAPLATTRSKPTPQVLPPEPSNPHHHSSHPPCSHLTRTGGLQPTHTLQAHEYAVSSVTFHPSKEVMVTSSDDHTWKMWALPSCELLMTGEGHTDWLSSASFHPSGHLLATASGDGTVKLWDFSKAQCTLTFPEHRQPVWSCSWHWSGSFVASGGMDHSCKVWDCHNGQCIVTLRGHTDSVNAVHFLPYSNTVATCSADKTVSLWDVRTGLCAQTYCGHQHSCNDITSNLQGQTLYSSDSLGEVLCWDLRRPEPARQWDFSPSAIHSLSTDPAGTILACAGGDGLIRLVDTTGSKEWVLRGHKDCVWGVAFSPTADTLLSCAGDGHVVVWR